MKGIEEIIAERERAKERRENSLKIALNFLKKGRVPLEEIAEGTGLTLEEVENLKKSILAPA